MTTEHFLPISLADLRRHAGEGAPAGVQGVLDRIVLLLRHESQERVDRLKAVYAAFDPNSDVGDGGTTTADAAVFAGELGRLLERANYQRISDAELQQAFTTESVFKVRLHTELADFAELVLFARGRHRRQEMLRSCFGLRKRVMEVEYFERVLLMVRFQGQDYFSKHPKRAKRLALVLPGSMQLKLFAQVPVADLEMLFPNAEVRMKNLDKVLIGGPALLGIGGLLSQVAILMAPLFYVAYKCGWYAEPVEMNTGKLAAILGAAFAIFLFINRQLGRYKFKRLQFIKTLADNLYFRNLDNNAGAFHRVADDALEEECKEAVLAYRFLAGAPATESDLDGRIEAWIKGIVGQKVDFEVDDALAKLERLGLAKKDGEIWKALDPADAAAVLVRQWQALPG